MVLASVNSLAVHGETGRLSPHFICDVHSSRNSHPRLSVDGLCPSWRACGHWGAFSLGRHSQGNGSRIIPPRHRILPAFALPLGMDSVDFAAVSGNHRRISPTMGAKMDAGGQRTARRDAFGFYWRDYFGLDAGPDTCLRVLRTFKRTIKLPLDAHAQLGAACADGMHFQNR